MTVRVALRAVEQRKLRSALTVLGVVVGVGAVIAMVSVGQGADAMVQAQINSLGTNLVMVVPGATTAGGVRSGWGGVSTLTVADARAIERECPSVDTVTHLKREIAQVIHGNQNWSTAIQGSPPSFPATRNWRVAVGSFFTQRDEEGAATVAVLGATVAAQLFGPGVDPVGTIIRIKNVPFRVVGVLAAKGQTSWGQDQDDVVVIPFNTAERRVIGAALLGTVSMILATSRSAPELQSLQEEIRALLHDRHRIPPHLEDDFTVRNMADMFEASANASRVMTILLASVASISLLVGGIGIMNMLLVSVSERTREIGLRMAVGAKPRHILLQFLAESMALSLVGGLMGIAVGVAVARAIARLAGWPVLVSPTAVLGGFLFAAAVGVGFGLYPARRAAGLNPIEALRFE
jgi:putative ABC transport system permease protein